MYQDPTLVPSITTFPEVSRVDNKTFSVLILNLSNSLKRLRYPINLRLGTGLKARTKITSLQKQKRWSESSILFPTFLLFVLGVLFLDNLWGSTVSEIFFN